MHHDLRLAIRGLWTSPVFSAITIATLTIGLGATIVIFSVVYGVLLNPLAVAFAGIALLLAAIGLYGLVAYTVSQRTPEIGIRLALGARPTDLVRMIVGHGLTLGALGVAIGLAGALAASRLMTSLLFETSPNDLVTYLAVPVALLLVVAVASLIPARRAARIDPVASLRT
jgi:putative ABC transport system permease protein